MKVVICRRCKKPYHQLNDDPKDEKGVCMKCLGGKPKKEPAK